MFPKKSDEMVQCPYCQGSRAFKISTTTITSELSDKSGYFVKVAFCRTCEKPIILHGKKVRNGSTPSSFGIGNSPTPRYKEETVAVYPVARRCFAPKEFRAEELDAWTQYKEAVNCEPYSCQAAVVLLSRCASIMLIRKCKAGKEGGLKDQFDASFKNGHLSEIMDTIEMKAAADRRNQVGHIWEDRNNELLQVNKDDVDWWFEITDGMIEELYVAPKKKAERISRLKADKKEKKLGDKAQVPV